jgi:4-alpha-glucanotransferase
VQNERKNVLRYLGNKAQKRKHLRWEFIRLSMMSAADLVIIPMQDLLGLGGKARMNRAGRARGNWEWRFRPDQLTSSLGKKLVEVTKVYGRA